MLFDSKARVMLEWEGGATLSFQRNFRLVLERAGLKNGARMECTACC